MFPSPVGVRPLTHAEDEKKRWLLLKVSVPCWGKAINTRKTNHRWETLQRVSVPCWGKAINTFKGEILMLELTTSFRPLLG